MLPDVALMRQNLAGRGMYMKDSIKIKYGDEGGKDFGCAAGVLPFRISQCGLKGAFIAYRDDHRCA